MTLKEFLKLIDKSSLQAAILKAVSRNGDIDPVRSIAIRIDDTGESFIVLYPRRCSGKDDSEVKPR